MAIGPSSRLTAAIMAGKKRVRPFGPSGVRGWKRSAGDAARMPRLSRYTFAGLACSGFASRQILSAAAGGLHDLVGAGPPVVAEAEQRARDSQHYSARATSTHAETPTTTQR